MSYTPTEWKSGDVITSENLNKLEQGVAAAGGGGGGVLIVVPDEDMEAPPSWITDIAPSAAVYETNVTYSAVHAAMASSPIGLSLPGVYTDFHSDFRTQPLAAFEDDGFSEEVNIWVVFATFYKYETGVLNKYEATLLANAEDGTLFLIVERSI